MDQHCEMILDEYRKKYHLYEKLDRIVLAELNRVVESFKTIVESVGSRIKTEESLTGKLELKGYKYQTLEDITDIYGARIVTFYMDEVDKYAAKIESTFEIDWENSIDKRKMHQIDQFGYMSLHYICKVPTELYYDPDNPEINDIKFEIQIRSILQHTWAAIQHDIGYKSDVEMPKEYLRSMNRLAGLLELADVSFYQLRNQIDDYRRRIRRVIKDGNLNDIELNGDSFNAYIRNGGFDPLNEKIATIANMEIEEVSLGNFLQVFKALGFKSLKQLDDFVKEYFDLAYEFSVRQFDGMDLDIISSVAGPLALCVVYILSNDMGEIVVRRLLDSIYGNRKTNARTAARLAKIGKSMGLVKSEDDDVNE